LAENRCIDELIALGWSWLEPHENETARDGLNQVILRDEFKAAIARINGIDAETAQAVYADVLNICDNEAWTKVLRGEYSRTVAGETKKRTIRLIDFQNPT
jgi:type I restriction enzyme, R subunit